MNSIENVFYTTKRIEIIEFEVMIETILNEKVSTYLLIIRSWENDLNKIYIFWRVLINNAIAKNKINMMIFMSKCLKHYKKLNIENENKIYTLIKHDFENYIIDFIENVEFLHDSIYFLFEKKFKIFKTYIDKHLVIDFIKYSQSFVETSILFVSKLL